jgi:hypothetical protein
MTVTLSSGPDSLDIKEELKRPGDSGTEAALFKIR